MAVKNEGLPDLEGYLEERGRHLVTYTEGARMYHIPYYSFVRLAKEAISYKKIFPVWSGTASRTDGKDYPVSSGISFPLERNMQSSKKYS